MDNYIIISLITSIAFLLAFLMRLCYSSKCKSIKFGNIEIIRDTEHEINISMHELKV